MYQSPDLQLLLSIISLMACVAVLVRWLMGLMRARQSVVFRKGNVPHLPVSGLIGHLNLFFSPHNIKLWHKHHLDLGKTFGLHYGPDPYAITCDPELLYRLFVVEGHRIVNINDAHLPFDRELSNSLAQLQGDQWRLMRKTLNPLFSSKQLKSDNVFKDIEDDTQSLLGRLKQAGDGSNVNVLHMSRRFSLGIICKVGFGIQNLSEKEADELIQIVHKIAEQGTSVAVYASILFGPKVQHFMSYMTKFTTIGVYFRRISKLIDDCVSNREKKMVSSGGGGNRKMIDTVIESVRRYKMGENVLKANLFHFFLAGFDTTSNSLAVLLWLLAKHPEKQEKLRTSVVMHNTSSDYLTWCIMEGLRLYPTVPTGFGRQLEQDYHYQDMTFFRGTSVVCNLYSLHRLEEFWGQDAAQFRPERFAKPLKHPLQYLAFSAGPRNCIGYNLAMLELRHVVSHLVATYRFVVPTNDTADTLQFTSPNLIHLIFEKPIELSLFEIK